MLDFLGTFEPQKILERARKLVAEGKTERAMRMLEKGLAGGKQDFDLLLELARLNSEQGSPKEVPGLLKRALAADPSRIDQLISDAEDIHYRSESALETGSFLFEVSCERRDFDEANRYLDGLKGPDIKELTERYEQKLKNIMGYKSEREMDPKDLSVVYELALLEVRNKRFAEVDALFKKALAISPKDIGKVIFEYERIAGLTFGDPKPRIAFGDLLVSSGNIPKALEQYKSAIEFDKTVAQQVIDRVTKLKAASPDPAIEKYLSELYIGHSQIDKAVTLMESGVSSGTFELGDAVKKFREIVRLEPDNPKAHLSLADVLKQEGSTDLAVSEYKEVFQLDPTQAETIIERLKEIIAGQSRNPLAINLLADIYMKQDDIPGAVRVLGKAYETDPGMSDEIISSVKKVLEKDLENPAALLLLAKGYNSKGETGEAVTILDALMSFGAESAKPAVEQLMGIMEKDPYNLEAAAALGMGLLVTGSFDRAADVFTSLPNIREQAPRIMERTFEICQKRPELADGAVRVLSYFETQDVDKFSLTMVLGELLSLAGNLDAAGEKFKQSFNADPGRVSDVISAFERLLQKNDQLSSAHMGLANCLLKKGDIDRAAQEFAKVLAMDKSKFDEILDRYYDIIRKEPKNTAVRMAIVDALAEKGMWDQLRAESERALEIVPPEQSGYFNLKKGQSLLAKGLLSESVPLIDKAVSSDSTLVGEAAALIDKIVKLDPKNAVARFSRARIATMQGDFAAAASEFLAIQRTHPESTDKVAAELVKDLKENRTNADLHFCLGEILVNAGMANEGIGEMEAATEIDSSFADRAAAKYEEIIEKKGGSASASLSLGRAYLKKGSYALATQNLVSALRAHPACRERVLHDLNEILEKQPDEITSRFALADIYRKEGDSQRAAALLKEIAELDPAQVDAVSERIRGMIDENKEECSLRYLLGDLLIKKGDVEDAVDECETILAQHPEETGRVMDKLRQAAAGGNPKALFAFATGLVKEKDYEEAVNAISQMTHKDFSLARDGISLLEQIHASKPAMSSASMLLGKLLAETGNHSKAAELFTSAMDYSENEKMRVECMLLRSRALRNGGQADRAKKEIDNAIAAAGSAREVYEKLAGIIQDENSLKLSRAVAELEKKPGDESLLIDAASLQRRTGNLEEAVNVLKFTSKDPETEIRRRNELAICMDSRGDPTAGIEILKGLELSEMLYSNPARHALSTLAYLYEETHELPLAVAALRLLASEDPDFDGAQERLSRLHNEMSVRSLQNKPNLISGVTTK
jgi:tetratricopeptide (TPR) repeat protein